MSRYYILIVLPILILSLHQSVKSEDEILDGLIDETIYIPDPIQEELDDYSVKPDEEALKLQHRHPAINSFKVDDEKSSNDLTHRLNLSTSIGSRDKLKVTCFDGLEYNNVGYEVKVVYDQFSDSKEIDNENEIDITSSFIYLPSARIFLGGGYEYQDRWEYFTPEDKFERTDNGLSVATRIDISDGLSMYSKGEVVISSLKHKREYHNYEISNTTNFDFLWPNRSYITKLNIGLDYAKMKDSSAYNNSMTITLKNDFPIKQKLFVSIGGKFQLFLNNNADTHLFPYLRVHYRITKGAGLYLKFNPYISPIKFTEDVLGKKFTIPSKPVKPQENYFNLEFGLNYNFTEGMDINLSLYRMDSLDYIYYHDYNSIEKEKVISGYLKTLSNMDKVTTNGIELSYIFTAIENFEQSASIKYEYIFNDENLSTNIPYSPKLKFTGSVKLHLLDHIDTLINGEYTGTRYSTINDNKLGGYFLINFKTTFWIKERYGIIAGIDNITNKSYEIIEGFQGRRRSIYAGFNLLI